MKALQQRAMRLLALRDYSEQELRSKLKAPQFSRYSPHHSQAKRSKLDLHSERSPSKEKTEIGDEDIEQVIQYCYQYHWLNDEEYTERFISSHSQKGYGVQRIRIALKQKGISSELIQRALDKSEIDWCAIVQQIAERKFYPIDPNDWSKRAKIQRYFLYRGFFQEEIQSIFTHSEE